jgi:hypothetical protein
MFDYVIVGGRLRRLHRRRAVLPPGRSDHRRLRRSTASPALAHVRGRLRERWPSLYRRFNGAQREGAGMFRISVRNVGGTRGGDHRPLG